MIYREKKYDEYFKEDNIEPVILSDGDKFNENYGGVDNFVLLTDEHIKALLEGKALFIDTGYGEYCCLIKKAEETKNEKDSNTI